MQDYDAIIVGAGFSGAVMAEQLASELDWQILVLEQRDHVAGNCHDGKTRDGITIHHYGPHLFHTSKQRVWEYLSRFSEWKPYHHKVLAEVDGCRIPLPFNLNSLRMVFPADRALELERKLLESYGKDSRVSILTLREAGDPDLLEVADWIYNRVFVNYTARQWGVDPEDISPDVLGRVPVVLSHDDRYFQDVYQAIPLSGYTRMIESMLDHPNITVQTNQQALSRFELVDGNGIRFDGRPFEGSLIYTGMLDELFGYCHGELPYRSLKFEFETLDYPYFQSNTTVNYPNESTFTRITEFKHILQEHSDRTVIVTEYPQEYDRQDQRKNIPYYPVFTAENQRRYDRYRSLATAYPQLTALGRLAEYRYLNMDDAVDNALSAADKLITGVRAGC